MTNEAFGNREIDIVSRKILEIRFVKEAAYNNFQRLNICSEDTRHN